MKKYVAILLSSLFSTSLWAGATFSRAHNWVDQEVLTATDLNAEFNNILNNLDPAGMDDYSLTLSQMQATVDPYPASVESLATDLKGEIERLRYQILQLKKAIQTTNSTYWYQDAPGQGTFTIKTSSVGVNNISPSYALDVTGDARLTGSLNSSSATFANSITVSTIATTLPSLYITTNAAVSGNLTVGGSFSVPSGSLTVSTITVTSLINLERNTLILGTKTGTQSLGLGSSNVTLTYTNSVDRNSEVSGSVFTAKNSGQYVVSTNFSISNTGAGSCLGTVEFRKNSSTIDSEVFNISAGNTSAVTRYKIVTLSAGDSLFLRASVSGGSPSAPALFIATTADQDHFVFIQRIP